MQATILERVGLGNAWAREAAMAALALGLGFGVMPLLIFLAGSTLLGRYDGASAARLYDAIYRGMGDGSLASWIVVFGPYGFYLLFKGLRAWWRAGTKAA
jgi:hypothetical protein